MVSNMESMQKSIHTSFDDLSQLDAVTMPVDALVSDTFEEHRPYYVHLSVTGRCNAKCAGCVNSNVTFRNSDNQWLSKDNDANPQRDAKAILDLTERLDEKEIMVSFYGGEPLLLPEKIQEVMSILSTSGGSKKFKYMVYTNGQLLGEVVDKYPDLIPNIWLWSVSIDGSKEQHNSIRPGTDLDIIRKNLQKLNCRETGPVLMWSTIREEQSLLDCFTEFISLHASDCVDLFFWHWVETESPFQSLDKYAVCYEKDLRHIMDVYISWLAGGRILPVIHLNELILYLLTGKARGTSACAVEAMRNFDIMGAKVHACADLPPEYAIGAIDENGIPHVEIPDLRSLIDYKEGLYCYQCGVHPYCGGRCPVQALTGTSERVKQYCQLMRLHVGVVMEYIPEIIQYVAKSRIPLQDMYDQSACYAQFTDVTP